MRKTNNLHKWLEYGIFLPKSRYYMIIILTTLLPQMLSRCIGDFKNINVTQIGAQSGKKRCLILECPHAWTRVPVVIRCLAQQEVRHRLSQQPHCSRKVAEELQALSSRHVIIIRNWTACLWLEAEELQALSSRHVIIIRNWTACLWLEVPRKNS